jgi:hypothetical protein
MRSRVGGWRAARVVDRELAAASPARRPRGQQLLARQRGTLIDQTAIRASEAQRSSDLLAGRGEKVSTVG